jgi:hypothetical protein
MFEFPSNNSASEKDSYSVAIWTDGIDVYDYFCFDHLEALQLAISDHKMAGRPLPMGTRFLVEGPCHDGGCDCGGKNRAKAGVIWSEAAGLGLTN